MERLKVMIAGYEQLYRYNATITDVYDGDTVTADIDLGFGVELKKQKLRLLYVAAPKVRGEERPAGLVSRDALREKILGKEVLILTKRDKKGKYGSYIATIFLPYSIITETEGEGGVININEWLIDNDYAEYKEY
jgi:micrococcal nuclease